ncbi:unnamed protein product [Rotaria socialis]
MPKTCEWSSDLRELVIKHHLNGDSIRTIVKKVDLSHSTIHSIIKKWNDTGSVMNRLGRGRKRHTTSRVDRIIHRTIISNRRKAAPDVAIDLKRDHNNKLKWPPQSPDLNPIEHIWDELERRLKPHSPKNKNELWNIMQKEWNGIGREVTSKLVDSMPNRLQEVMKHHGGPTRY